MIKFTVEEISSMESFRTGKVVTAVKLQGHHDPEEAVPAIPETIIHYLGLPQHKTGETYVLQLLSK